MPFVKGQKPWNYNKQVGICLICKKEFLAPLSDFTTRATHVKPRKYCSRNCKVKSQIGSKHPYLSGSNNPNWVGGLPKCLDCCKQLSTYKINHCRSCRQKGERSHFWKGGITPEVKRIRTSKKYQLWRDAVFKRDNYTCTWCGIRNEDGLGRSVILNADHIKRFAEYPELRFELSNGRTLCVDCHRKTGTFGRLGLNV